MKIALLVLSGALKRAFTKSNGSVIATTSAEGVWDLEATLAWFLRGLLVIALLYIAQRLEIDVATLNTLLNS